jgi:hypothetical protein
MFTTINVQNLPEVLRVVLEEIQAVKQLHPSSYYFVMARVHASVYSDMALIPLHMQKPGARQRKLEGMKTMFYCALAMLAYESDPSWN